MVAAVSKASIAAQPAAAAQYIDMVHLQTITIRLPNAQACPNPQKGRNY